jgi:Protein of unknown function (DUF2569)
MAEGYNLSSNASARSTSGSIEPGRKKVGGWLLVLCIMLTIVSPLLTITVLCLLFSIVADFPKLLGTVVLMTVVTVPLACYSLYAGVALWKIKPGATSTAKNYLIMLMFCSLSGLALSFLQLIFSHHSPRATETTFLFSLIETILTLLSVSIWHSYLNRSKRVGETYDEVVGNRSISLKING